MNDKPKNDGMKFNPVWIGAGTAIGTAIGVSMKNIGVGVAIGVAIGVVLAFAIPTPKK